jgi:hypothetical protein
MYLPSIKSATVRNWHTSTCSVSLSRPKSRIRSLGKGKRREVGNLARDIYIHHYAFYTCNSVRLYGE